MNTDTINNKFLKNETIPLDPIYSKTLSQLLVFEKSSKKRYQKLAKASLTPELTKALHPEQTNIDNHINRLKLISPDSEASINPSSINVSESSWNKKKNNLQDLEIINEALSVLGFKIAHYEFLFLIAKAMEQEHSPELLMQSISENNDTCTWLKQIARNVILPKL